MEALDNLVKTQLLNREPPDQAEFDGMVSAAKVKLTDVRLEGLSTDSQFSLAYGAAHAWHWRRFAGVGYVRISVIWCSSV